MRDLQIKFKKLKEKDQTSRISTRHKSGPMEGIVHMSMQCDSIDYSKRECEDFLEVLHKEVVFFKDGTVHLKESGKKLKINFDKGRMKVFVGNTFNVHTISSNEASTFQMGANPRKYLSRNLEYQGKSNSLQSSTMNYAKKEKFTKINFKNISNNIQQIIAWDDLVDRLSIHAHIARN